MKKINILVGIVFFMLVISGTAALRTDTANAVIQEKPSRVFFEDFEEASCFVVETSDIDLVYPVDGLNNIAEILEVYPVDTTMQFTIQRPSDISTDFIVGPAPLIPIFMNFTGTVNVTTDIVLPPMTPNVYTDKKTYCVSEMITYGIENTLNYNIGGVSVSIEKMVACNWEPVLLTCYMPLLIEPGGVYESTWDQKGAYGMQVETGWYRVAIGYGYHVDDVSKDGTGYAYFSITDAIPSVIDINPDTLNLKNKGKWITCYIELPDEYDVEDINIGTILLNDIVPAEDHSANIGDYDNDGILNLMVKFDRQETIEILEPGENVVIMITGELIDGTLFEGTDYIRVIYKPSPPYYPPICYWIESKGGPTGLTVPDIYELIDAYLLDIPLPDPYNFIPTSLEIYGVIDYFNGDNDNGDTNTGCSYC